MPLEQDLVQNDGKIRQIFITFPVWTKQLHVILFQSVQKHPQGKREVEVGTFLLFAGRE